MFLDFEDYRPETPRLTSAISPREGVLLSLLVHAALLIVWLVTPKMPAKVPVPLAPETQPPAIEFVHIVPRVELQATAKPHVDMSDQDRRAAAPTPVPSAENAPPPSRGDTPEKVVGAPVDKPAGAERPVSAPSTGTVVPDIATKVAPDTSSVSAPPPSGSLGSSLRNLQQFLQNQNFENQLPGQADQNADIQFDSKGVEFGPWLRRFVAQVKRNWYVPQAAMTLKGRVVIQFYVLRNGTITDIKIVKPSPIESFNVSAFNSLKLSNPTLALPPEYPDDRAFFTVTFHYNEGIDR